MPNLGVIGGTGLDTLEALKVKHREMVTTPYGHPSGPILFGEIEGKEVAFLARHGYRHTLTPHEINYRANIWALKHLGVKRIMAVAAVGGITAEIEPQSLVIPNQIIDYATSRINTYCEGKSKEVVHVDFTWPYDEILREILIGSAKKLQLNVVEQAVYGVTEGPRLETAAEIDRMQRDGCDIVGMTQMPEAVLARELNIKYVTCAVVVNRAAGRDGEHKITMEDIEHNLKKGMDDVKRLLVEALPRLI